jgi:ribosomal-protein-alanine N-acetyltransferase
MISIRKATLQDLERIHNIETLCFHEGSYPLFVLRQLFDISQHYFLVAQEDNMVLGYVIGNRTKENDQGWVLSLGVHPDARGQKVGSKLMEQLVKLLENSQSREICLTVHPNNAAAVQLYENVGFEVTATYGNYYLYNEPRLLMIKQTVYDRINS